MQLLPFCGAITNEFILWDLNEVQFNPFRPHGVKETSKRYLHSHHLNADSLRGGKKGPAHL